jgi:ATP-dependent protease HslVU (ClpYQ) peptidase subunit
MSICVAVKKNGKIAFGADTLVTFGDLKPSQGNVCESKFRKIGNVYLATTGWSLYDNIIDDMYAESKDISIESRSDVFSFFKKFWDKLHKDYSFVNDQCGDDDSPFGHLDSSFLVTTTNNIFYVSSNMSVTEFDKFHAIGSGCDFAIGAMYSVYEGESSVTQIAQTGIKAAIEHDVHCGGEIEVIEL